MTIAGVMTFTDFLKTRQWHDRLDRDLAGYDHDDYRCPGFTYGRGAELVIMFDGEEHVLDLGSRKLRTGDLCQLQGSTDRSPPRAGVATLRTLERVLYDWAREEDLLC